MSKKIFIAEDNAVYREVLDKLLTDHGCQTFLSDTGERTVEKIAEVRPDVALLDIELPGMLGTEICKRVRQIKGLELMPIVLMTGNDTDVHFLAGVEFKATTVFSKARKLEILLATIDSLTRQIATADSDDAPIVIGSFCINPETQKILLDGGSIDLQAKPFALALLLVQSRPKAFNRHELMRRLGIRHNGVKEIDVFMHSIREAFGASGPRLFRNSRGKGFFFDESAL